MKKRVFYLTWDDDKLGATAHTGHHVDEVGYQLPDTEWQILTT